jgi:hypothetical protein
MILVKTASGQKLQVTKKEWKEYGEKAGWITVAKKRKKKKPQPTTEKKDKDAMPPLPTQAELFRDKRVGPIPKGGPMSTPKGKKAYDRKDKSWKKDTD